MTLKSEDHSVHSHCEVDIHVYILIPGLLISNIDIDIDSIDDTFSAVFIDTSLTELNRKSTLKRILEINYLLF